LRKGSEITGLRYADSIQSIRYHLADRRGHAYKCNCMPMFRIGDKVFSCPTKRYKKDRAKNYCGRSTTNLWYFIHHDMRLDNGNDI